MSTINLDRYGGSGIFTWSHEYLNRVLTTGKNPIIKTINLKNSFRSIKREDFIPEEFQEYAYQDKDLNIGYGCVLNKPTVIAEMLALLNPKLGGKFLDIGTGTGYTAALLGVAAGVKGVVYSLERVQFLVDIARLNLAKYPEIKNVEIVFRDGSQGLPDFAPFDGIHISASLPKILGIFKNQLQVGGRLVVPTENDDIRLIERISTREFKETVKKGYFFDIMKQGIA